MIDVGINLLQITGEIRNHLPNSCGREEIPIWFNQAVGY